MAGKLYDAGNQFPDWLLEQLKIRGWTREELSRRADVPSSAITNIVNRTKGVGPDVARRIATALDVSPVLVFRIAGLLPNEGDNNDDIWEQLEHEFSQLESVEDKLQALRLLRAYRQAAAESRLQGRDRNGKTRKPAKGSA